MNRAGVLFIYNLLLPIFFVIAFPGWLVKMWRRGGFGSGLRQRFAIYDEVKVRGGIYIHAVSVGEVLIALRLIEQWQKVDPEEKFLLVPTTSTGHAVAVEKAPAGVQVIYSPLDFPFLLNHCFSLFEPRLLVLIEAEAWPNLLNRARKHGIPTAFANARLSERSEARFKKFAALTKPIFSMMDLVLVQNDADRSRFASLGIAPERIEVSGSIKFDPTGSVPPARRDEFQLALDGFGAGRQVVLVASTHTGEELLIANEFLKLAGNPLLVVVPRHAERRGEIIKELAEIGLKAVVRSRGEVASGEKGEYLLADTTGELKDWNAHADVVVVGKSFLGRGGQNPVEAISAGVPVVTGPHMRNFEPLVSELENTGALRRLSSADELKSCLSEILSSPEGYIPYLSSANEVLHSHEGATIKSVKALQNIALTDPVNP